MKYNSYLTEYNFKSPMESIHIKGRDDYSNILSKYVWTSYLLHTRNVGQPERGSVGQQNKYTLEVSIAAEILRLQL